MRGPPVLDSCRSRRIQRSKAARRRRMPQSAGRLHESARLLWGPFVRVIGYESWHSSLAILRDGSRGVKRTSGHPSSGPFVHAGRPICAGAAFLVIWWGRSVGTELANPVRHVTQGKGPKLEQPTSAARGQTASIRRLRRNALVAGVGFDSLAAAEIGKRRRGDAAGLLGGLAPDGVAGGARRASRFIGTG